MPDLLCRNDTWEPRPQQDATPTNLQGVSKSSICDDIKRQTLDTIKGKHILPKILLCNLANPLLARRLLAMLAAQ
jgi:hypothetical protein